jgi:hypothetical protein
MKSKMNASGTRRGFVSMPILFVFLGMLVLFSFLINTGLVVSRKIDAQNAADAVAYSTALQRAKGMNAITAANHLMGELQAIAIMHHSFGGDELDDSSKPRKKMDKDVKTFLRFSYRMARTMGSFKPFEFTYNAVYKDPEVGGAIGDSRVRLQHVMTWAYVTHSIGGFLQTIGKFIPYAGKIIEGYGMTVAIVATAFEVKAYQEWMVITGFEKIARVTKPVKTTIQKALPAINLYAKGMTVLVPFYMTPKALKTVGEENEVVADMFPGPYLPPAMLPVEAEPSVLSASMLQRSQLTRAATPWVRHWRVPVLLFSEAVLKLSRFKMFYVDHTNNWTLELVKRAKKDNVNLLIMKDVKLTTDDKGNEKWTKKAGSKEADELFCTLGFAIRKSPKYLNKKFRNPTPDGIFAYAQAMVYNANKQQAKARPNEQRILGWDTLNWDETSPIPAWKKDDTSKTFPVANVPEPRIKLNWSVKLVPTTRMTLSTAFIKGLLWEEGRPHFKRIVPNEIQITSQTRTH